MKVGFTQETEEQQESELGTAEADETEDDDEWFAFFFPKVLDFCAIYGLLSVTRDTLNYLIKQFKGG
jgi:hypothetical protein|tara:strand:+ start:607 stop:807 length:201 start_codon:yes stop_codon:yes gene_type:complete